MSEGYETKVTDEQREFCTGANRNSAAGKGRFDLLPFDELWDVAKLYERVAQVREDRNWEKGMSLGCYLDSAMRHLVQMRMGMEDEDHASAVVFNAWGFKWTKKKIEAGELPLELDDLGIIEGGS